MNRRGTAGHHPTGTVGRNPLPGLTPARAPSDRRRAGASVTPACFWTIPGRTARPKMPRCRKTATNIRAPRPPHRR